MTKQQIQERKDKFTEFLNMNLEYEENKLHETKQFEFGKITKEYKNQSEVVFDLRKRLITR